MKYLDLMNRTDLQKLASGRNWLKARLLGAMTVGCGTELTQEEQIIMKDIRNSIILLLRNIDQSNIKLGLTPRKPKKRFK